MSTFNKTGGLRLKITGRNNKDRIISSITRLLDSLCQENDLESFSGVNLYLQMFDHNGDRLALVGPDDQVAQGIDVTNIEEGFSFSKSGYGLTTVKLIEEMEEKQLEEEKKAEAAYEAEIAEIRRKEREEKQELASFRAFICEKYSVKHINEVMSSIGRIKDRKAILKHIDETQIPECGYVFRATHKTSSKGKARVIDIYDNTFSLING